MRSPGHWSQEKDFARARSDAHCAAGKADLSAKISWHSVVYHRRDQATYRMREQLEQRANDGLERASCC